MEVKSLQPSELHRDLIFDACKPQQEKKGFIT